MTTPAIQQAIEALENAANSLRWFGEEFPSVKVGHPTAIRIDAALAALRAESAPRSVTPPALDKNILDAMVNRFAGWPLPKTFGPDCGIRFTPLDHPNHWPTGTNLFTADEARAMLVYVLDQTFIPEWSMLEATQESLREHMALVRELREKLDAAPLPQAGGQPEQQNSSHLVSSGPSGTATARGTD